MLILLKLFQKIAEEGTLPKFLQGHHHSDNKTRQRHYKKRKSEAKIHDKHKCKNPQQNSSKQIQQYIKESYTMIKSDFSKGCRILQYTQIKHYYAPY